jgi:hypothetical protein
MTYRRRFGLRFAESVALVHQADPSLTEVEARSQVRALRRSLKIALMAGAVPREKWPEAITLATRQYARYLKVALRWYRWEAERDG